MANGYDMLCYAATTNGFVTTNDFTNANGYIEAHTSDMVFFIQCSNGELSSNHWNASNQKICINQWRPAGLTLLIPYEQDKTPALFWDSQGPMIEKLT